MVKLRLKRMGSKYNAFYRIVAADSRAPRDGKYIEDLGFYNPHTKEIKLNEELKAKWLNEGAVPSETVKKLFAKLEKQGNKGEVTKLPAKPKKVKKAAPEIVAEEAKVEEKATKETSAEAEKEEATEAPKEEATTEEAPKSPEEAKDAPTEENN